MSFVTEEAEAQRSEVTHPSFSNQEQESLGYSRIHPAVHAHNSFRTDAHPAGAMQNPGLKVVIRTDPIPALLNITIL